MAACGEAAAKLSPAEFGMKLALAPLPSRLARPIELVAPLPCVQYTCVESTATPWTLVRPLMNALFTAVPFSFARPIVV